MTTKNKKYYRVGEKVWIKPLKREGFIKNLEIRPQEKLFQADVEYLIERDDVPYRIIASFDLKELDKYRKDVRQTVYFSKLKENAVIPSKREEDGGYDFYTCSENEEIVCEVGKPTLIPTGIACAMPKTLLLNLKHERGSTAKLGMSVLAGLVDSGYRGEIWINICALEKPVIISKKVDEKKVEEDKIYYPMSKAIAQGTFEHVPSLNIKEITHDDLLNIESERGTSQLGESGK